MDLAQVNEELVQIREVIKRQEEKIEKTSIRAPSSGFVHRLKAHSIGEVIAPGTTILEVVPQDHDMLAEIEISSRDIGHVKLGQPVKLKFTTYDFSRYGGIEGTLKEISATTYLSPAGNPYYKGIVLFTKSFVGSNPQTNPILPGMTVQAEIRTGDKTITEYLLKPIFASAKQALRER